MKPNKICSRCSEEFYAEDDRDDACDFCLGFHEGCAWMRRDLSYRLREAELQRYRERESVHIRPLLSAMRGQLMFPDAPETESVSDMLKRINQASSFCISSAAEAAHAAADTTGVEPIAPTK